MDCSAVKGLKRLVGQDFHVHNFKLTRAFARACLMMAALQWAGYLRAMQVEIPASTEVFVLGSNCQWSSHRGRVGPMVVKRTKLLDGPSHRHA